MKTPPFLVGAALLFWGWQTGYMMAGLVLAVGLELAHWTKVRWEFSDHDFTRIWTFCSLLLLVATLYAFTSNDAPSDLISFLQNPSFRTQRNAGNSSARAVAELIRWQPLIFLPFVLVTAYSAREGVPLHTISLILRRRWQKAQQFNQPLAEPALVVGMGYPYFTLCLFSSSIEPGAPDYFFWGSCVLIAWALWPLRSKRFGIAAWVAATLVAFFLGFVGQRSFAELQQYLGNFDTFWLSKYSRQRFDARLSRTMIGHLGRAKASGAIAIRVQTPEDVRAPALLREASYREYKGQMWYSTSTKNDFVGIPSETNTTSYVLIPEKTLTNAVKIACYLPGGQGLLPLPRGVSRLDNLHAYIVEKNNFGALHAEGPGLVIFDALYGPGATIDIAPDDETDRNSVPERERPALEDVARQLNLENPTLHQAMHAVQAYFSSNFVYSTWQDPPFWGKTNETPLSRFLLKSRRGHCEYFATATVLLMRQLGFQARYAVGYAVHEAAGKNRYVVRHRDAHAWCLVWNNGVWLDFDTTPGTWIHEEGQQASPFQGVSDFFSRIRFEIARVRWGQSHLREYLLYTSLPVLGVLLIQIVRTRRKRRQFAKETGVRQSAWPGLDSELYELEQRFAQRSMQRASGEPLAEWLTRAAASPEFGPIQNPIHELLRLHYRYRFDPCGLLPEERALLRSNVAECLRNLPKRRYQFPSEPVQPG